MKVLRSFLLTVGLLLPLIGIGFYLRPLEFYDDFTYLQAALHGVSNHWVTVDGMRLHYEVQGPSDGKPVVLIHVSEAAPRTGVPLLPI